MKLGGFPATIILLSIILTLSKSSSVLISSPFLLHSHLLVGELPSSLLSQHHSQHHPHSQPHSHAQNLLKFSKSSSFSNSIPHSPLIVDELPRLLNAQTPASQTLLHHSRAQRVRKQERHLMWNAFLKDWAQNSRWTRNSDSSKIVCQQTDTNGELRQTLL